MTTRRDVHDLLQAVQEMPREALPAILAAVAGRLAEPCAQPIEAAVATFPAAPDDRLLTPKEAADRLGLSVRQFYRRAGTFPFVRKLGRRTSRVSERELNRYLGKSRA